MSGPPCDPPPGSRVIAADGSYAYPPPPATTPVEPAFPLRSATIWSVVLTYRIGADQLNRQCLVMSADPSGADLVRIAVAKAKADAPGATDVRVLRIEMIGEAHGTAVVFGGAS